MSRRRQATPEELRLWREVVRDAEPLPGRASASDAPSDLAPAPPAAAVVPAAQVPAGAIAPRVRTRVSRPALPPLDLDGTPGVDRRTDDRLRRGRFEIEGRLDLHGMTQAQAHDALFGFVRRNWHEGRRVLLVITGKGSGGEGMGVLRAAVPRWLGESGMRAMVVAIHRAQPRHGGDGALYLLLKRKRDPR